MERTTTQKSNHRESALLRFIYNENDDEVEEENNFVKRQGFVLPEHTIYKQKTKRLIISYLNEEKRKDKMKESVKLLNRSIDNSN